ncbi:MAG: trypsin-like serine protease [Candidatus Eisenbacteria bacterium]|uniref:Trypsin-like serine protease n=1 Tax=Eiseniibacteriota bacterium TaxID=2212470 RepID=A0A538U858_UNCEI|nr:MAG: trypsin-like serine protease [Candidatus Eisenbacteria bacterium]
MRETIKLVCAAVLGAALWGLSVSAERGPTRSTSADSRPRAAAGISEARDLSAGFENAAATVSPSVVTIIAARQVTVDEDPMLQMMRQFFGNDAVPDGGTREEVQRALGSGVIVSKAGHILTNYHVVKGAQQVTVRLSDGRKLDARVTQVDSRTDLAVLRVHAGLRPAPIGDSSRLRIGEWVVAVGNPFGFTSTVTAGIVSAKGRTQMGLAQREDFIQTDAAINPGNSGGPLVNLRGEVVGINTAIFSQNGGYMGIGFAIPINLAKSILRNGA